MIPVEERICIECRLALAWSENLDDGTGEWVHDASILAYDGIDPHDPVPVVPNPVLEARYHCDFCFDRGPRWTYPAQDFVIDGTNEAAGSGGAWAACDLCHDLIEADDWKTLVERATDRNPSMQVVVRLRGKETARAMLAPFYAQFRDARIGPAYEEFG